MITTEHTDIASLWGDPYLELVKHWDRVEAERKQKLQREYQEMDDIAQKIEKDREEFRRILDRVLDNPVNRFIDNVAIPVFVFATIKQPYSPACASMTATARVVAPRMGQVATTLGTVEISRELTTFFNKKAGSDTNPRAGSSRIQNSNESQKSFIDKQKSLGNWQKTTKRIGGRESWYDKVKNLYYTKDTRHFDIEVWKVTGKKAYHQGSIEPYTGQLYKGASHAPQDVL